MLLIKFKSQTDFLIKSSILQHYRKFKFLKKSTRK